MAVLRQLAWLPSSKEMRLFRLLSSVKEIWQAHPLYGNLAQSAYLRLVDNAWLKLASDNVDVQFKFECISLSVSRCVVPMLTESFERLASVSLGNVKLVFRSEWQRPTSDNFSEDEWTKLVCGVASFKELPTRRVSGCVAWWGILFLSETGNKHLVHLDDFPLSIHVDSDRSSVDARCAQCQLVNIDEIEEWTRSLRGWEILERG